ncbi:MAG: nuclear transport factor 2 family protein [Gammaproteobacteria bacterium]|nr:nuclear transport factor 2 family protein [Gammaproteobacteria bacterium]
MGIIDAFERFAADFERTIEDDDWSRLEKYLAEDATYLNVGGPDPKCAGREAIIAFLKADVSNTDRRFDTRTLIALTPPTAAGNRLSRQWRCTYTLAEATDLVLEGEARYVFEGDLIKEIEEELTAVSMQKFYEWMQNYGDRLHA